MTVKEAELYYWDQVAALAGAGVDLVSGMTFHYVEEAIGLAIACRRVNIPLVVSFTLEIDGKLPSGDTIQSAIETIDAETDSFPIYYMLNCCHPVHFALPWTQRIKGIQANSSIKSHAELCIATELDKGEPLALAQALFQLKCENRQLMVLWD